MTTPPIEEEHSNVMGGSTTEIRTNCPGSYALAKDLPRDDKGSEHAERGTALHQAIEFYLLDMEEDGLTLDDMEGMNFNNFTITQELIDDKLKPALAAFKEIIASMGGEVDYMVEVKASLGTQIPGAFGTIDILGRASNGRILVLDWKFGDGVKVSVKGSKQHGFYAACALYDEDEDIKDLIGTTGAVELTFAVVQPRPSYPNEPDYEVWETTSEWVEDLTDLLCETYEKMMGPNPPLKTGAHCRWCPAKHICPEQQRGVFDVASSVPTAEMDVVTIAKMLEQAAQAEDAIKAIRQHALAELERGVKIPGWKLVPKRATRRYNDEAAAEEAIRKMSGVKISAAMNHTLKSPAQLQKSAGISPKRWAKFSEEHISMVSSGSTMARDTDPRPDVSDPLTLLGQHTANLADNTETET